MGKNRPYQRTERLNSRVREVLAVACQRETREEALRNAVITGVEVTRDLSVARVYYYVIGEGAEEVRVALERASGFLRSRVGQEVRMRQTPELRFHFDNSVDHGRRVEGILADLHIPTEQVEAVGLGSEEE
jgi:ribosome-binding factor A